MSDSKQQPFEEEISISNYDSWFYEKVWYVLPELFYLSGSLLRISAWRFR